MQFLTNAKAFRGESIFFSYFDRFREHKITCSKFSLEFVIYDAYIMRISCAFRGKKIFWWIAKKVVNHVIAKNGIFFRATLRLSTDELILRLVDIIQIRGFMIPKNVEIAKKNKEFRRPYNEKKWRMRTNILWFYVVLKIRDVYDTLKKSKR